SRRKEIRDHNGQAGAIHDSAEIIERTIEVGGAGTRQAAEELADSQDGVVATTCRAVRHQSVGQSAYDDPVLALESNVCQCCGQGGREMRLWWFAVLHRVGAIDQYRYCQVFLGFKYTQEKPLQPRVCTPINAAKIISGRVAAVVCELHR